MGLVTDASRAYVTIAPNYRIQRSDARARNPLLRRHPDRAVEADHFAVQHRVADDLARRATRTRPAARAAAETAPSCRAHPATSGGRLATIGVSKMPGRDRHHANAVARELARDRQRHPDDAGLRRAVGRLADLAVERGDRRRVDDHAALAVGVRRVLAPSPRRRAGSC